MAGIFGLGFREERVWVKVLRGRENIAAERGRYGEEVFHQVRAACRC